MFIIWIFNDGLMLVAILVSLDHGNLGRAEDILVMYVAGKYVRSSIEVHPYYLFLNKINFDIFIIITTVSPHILYSTTWY
jgi:hypothetical protein